jgi:hypothetical protein
LSSRSDPDPNVQQSSNERRLAPFDDFFERGFDFEDIAVGTELNCGVVLNAFEGLFLEAKQSVIHAVEKNIGFIRLLIQSFTAINFVSL